MSDVDPHLPGADLVSSGLAALHRGDLTPEALLVCIGAPRLRRLGIELPADGTFRPSPSLPSIGCSAPSIPAIRTLATTHSYAGS